MSNQETAITYGLTSTPRVKERLGISGTNLDTLINNFVADVTDFIQGECRRIFKEATYTNEVYSVYNQGTRFLQINNAPVGTVTGVQYRAGLKSNPSWTDFQIDTWELLGDGSKGILRIYGGLFDGVNSIRLSYTAGYKIDFPNVGDITKHTLPYDLTGLAERLITKLYKKRENEGKLSETFEGGTVQWKELLDDNDKMTIAKYSQVPTFV